MDSKKSNKIRDIVRLQQILKKWKKIANASKNNNATNSTSSSTATTTTTTTTTTSSSSASKSIKFLKRTLSFQDVSGASNDAVPKGFLAVCVGIKEGAAKRFIIPTEYLSHQAFGILLRQAEEEFGFQQEGVLKIPCEVAVFEKILKVVEDKREVNFFFMNEFGFAADKDKVGCYSPPSDCELSTPHHPQMCR